MAQTRNGDDYSFAWNGDGARSDPYLSHGIGTFNINPKGGMNGFYIGEQTMSAILTNKANKEHTHKASDVTDLQSAIDARLPYPLYAVPSTGLLKDRAINTTNLASVTVPNNFTDLLIRASVTTSLPVTMPEAITKYGDTFPSEAGEYLITITKIGASEVYVRTIKLEVAQ